MYASDDCGCTSSACVFEMVKLKLAAATAERERKSRARTPAVGSAASKMPTPTQQRPKPGASRTTTRQASKHPSRAASWTQKEPPQPTAPTNSTKTQPTDSLDREVSRRCHRSPPKSILKRSALPTEVKPPANDALDVSWWINT